MNKPLTPERRAVIEHLIQYERETDGGMDKPLQELLSAEAYWREAVKKAYFEYGCGEEDDHCPFCKESGRYEIQHAPDCPYKLAQDE